METVRLVLVLAAALVGLTIQIVALERFNSLLKSYDNKQFDVFSAIKEHQLHSVDLVTSLCKVILFHLTAAICIPPAQARNRY